MTVIYSVQHNKKQVSFQKFCHRHYIVKILNVVIGKQTRNIILTYIINPNYYQTLNKMFSLPFKHHGARTPVHCIYNKT